MANTPFPINYKYIDGEMRPVKEHWRTCHIEGCSGLLCGGVTPQPEPNWRSMYEAEKKEHEETIEAFKELRAAYEELSWMYKELCK